MRRAALCAAAALWVSQAQAQSTQPPAIAVPPPPAIVAAPAAVPPPAALPPALPAPPGLVQTPLSPPDPATATGDNTDTGAEPAPPAAPAATPPVPANTWLPGTTAQLRVLDKVDGGVADLSIPVGGQATAGNLQISVLACALRPPGQIPDSAIFLSITPTGDSAPPSYRGWMVRSVPAAAVVGNASESFRVVGCS
jgi:hypothetical protein